MAITPSPNNLTDLPGRMTDPLWDFVRDSANLWQMTQRITAAPYEFDKLKLQLAGIAQAVPGEFPGKAEAARVVASGFDSTRQVLAHAPLLFQMILCRSVDSYLTYVSGVLGLVFRTKPDVLKSQRTVTFEEVLGQDSIEALVNYLAEEQVIALAYKGMRDLDAELRKRPGLALFENAQQLEEAVRLIETRNLIVHSRGVVNRLYVRRTQSNRYKVGDIVVIEIDELSKDVTFLFNSAVSLDDRAARKFGLPTPRDPKKEKAPPNYDGSAGQPTIPSG